jgi:Zn-dependent peptidase ImmA (M78 family)
MSKVAISDNVLRWAMKRAGLGEAQLAAKLPKVTGWLSHTEQPTLKQLEKFARITRTPLGYLFLDDPPAETLPIPHFRTLDDGLPSEPSPDLLDSVYAMQRRQAWLRESRIERGFERLPFVGALQVNDNPKKVSEAMRRVLNLARDWASRCTTWSDALRVLREALENADLTVVVNGVVGNNTHRGLRPEEFRGFVLVDDYAPLLFVNGKDGKAAQMFTLAHELAHVFFGSSAAFDLREMQPAQDPVEIACNQAAAEFLVPEAELRELWPRVKDGDEPVELIARAFKVSSIVAARRALDLKLLTRDVFFQLHESYLLDEKRRKAAERDGRGDFFATQNMRVGKQFALELAGAASEGRILYSEAYELTGLYGQTFHRYVDLVTEGEARP